MKALITGATGFVGANLVEAVTRHGWTARALRRASSPLQALEGLDYETAIGDVTDPDSLRAAMRGVDVVFHAAAVADYWRTGAQRMMQVNVDGARNVFAAALEAGVRRVVFTSSAASLGRPPFGQTLDERAVFNLPPGRFLYGSSKAQAEQVAAGFVARGLEVVTVNPAVIIGPRDVHLISGSIIVEASRHWIPVYPPGGVCVIDVADVCAAQISAAERGRPGERYILGGENLWYRDLFGVVCDAVGRRRPALRLPRPVMRAAASGIGAGRALGLPLPVDEDQARLSAETMWFDSSKARRELGLATRPFAEAARRTVEWYKMHQYL
jgi:dihydroflavonol-4-reductase